MTAIKAIANRLTKTDAFARNTQCRVSNKVIIYAFVGATVVTAIEYTVKKVLRIS